MIKMAMSTNGNRVTAVNENSLVCRDGSRAKYFGGGAR